MEKKNQYFPQSYPHPGETLAEKLDEMDMGPKEFAIRTGKPEKTIIAILNGGSSITADMAIQFENVTKIPAHFWLNHQRSYDEYIAREKRKLMLDEAVNWMKSFPMADLIKKGWIEKVQSSEEKTAALLAFFGFSSHTAWENYYLNQQLKVVFRISLACTKESHALSSWLRKGELQAADLKTNAFDEKKFKASLTDLKTLMVNHPKDFFLRLQKLCAATGVKVVYTPCLPKAPISGSTRWLNDGSPLIQLSGRYKRNDSFWFTFFHEAGHILLHGTKEIFLEDIDYSDKDLEKEKEADTFAIRWTFSEQQEAELLENEAIDERTIIAYAKKFNTHPAMIIGRLQKKGLVPYSMGRKFIIPIQISE